MKKFFTRAIFLAALCFGSGANAFTASDDDFSLRSLGTCTVTASVIASINVAEVSARNYDKIAPKLCLLKKSCIAREFMVILCNNCKSLNSLYGRIKTRKIDFDIAAS